MGSSFKDRTAWQQAMELALAIYKLTNDFPKDERFGLVNQMRRAAVSVPSNIAEGYARASTGEYIQFLGHARGSCSELETQLILARSLKYGAANNLDEADGLCTDAGRLLCALMNSLRAKQSQVPSPLVP
jgi:four helix bundle protein